MGNISRQALTKVVKQNLRSNLQGKIGSIMKEVGVNPAHAASLKGYEAKKVMMKLKEKVRVGGQLKKKYDTAQTPYQRLLRSRSMGREKKQELTELYLTLNPVRLRRDIEQHLALLRKLVRDQKEKRMQPARVTFLMSQRIPAKLHS